MARPEVDEKLELVPFPIRLPRAFVAGLEAEALAKNMNRSDVLRQYISAEKVREIGSPHRHRIKGSSLDPERRALVNGVAKVGNNLNQIARSCNQWADPTDPDFVALLIQLAKIESEIQALKAK